jgi:hypothetical protein
MSSQFEKDADEKMVQMGLAVHVSKLGWTYADDESLHRPLESVFRADDVMQALVSLNPEIKEVPARAEEASDWVLGRIWRVLGGPCGVSGRWGPATVQPIVPDRDRASPLHFSSTAPGVSLGSTEAAPARGAALTAPPRRSVQPAACSV